MFKIMRVSVVLAWVVISVHGWDCMAESVSENTVQEKASQQQYLLTDEFDSLNNEKWQVKNQYAMTEEGRLILNTSDSNVQVTSVDNFLYGVMEAKIKITKPANDNRFYYIGFFDRESWGKSCSYIMIQGNAVFFISQKDKDSPMLRKTAKDDLESYVWYAVKIVWGPKRTELFINDKSLAYTEDVQYIPSMRLPIIIDTFSVNGGEVEWGVDWVRVSPDTKK